MKTSQRLDNSRLAEILAERAMVDPQALREAAQFASHGKIPFTEALVTANLVQDWELSRVVCELYNLPFLPVDLFEPDARARTGLDMAFLAEHCLVPMGRYGNLLTIAMPAMVPADVLGLLASTTDLFLLPVVGSVRSNRIWLQETLTQQTPAALPAAAAAAESSGPTDWSAIFDQADASVLLDLRPPPDEG